VPPWRGTLLRDDPRRTGLCRVISDCNLRRLDFGSYARELEGLQLDDLRVATRNSTVFRGVAPSGQRVAIKRVASRERAELEYRSLAELFESTRGEVPVAKPVCLIADHGLVVLEWVAGRRVYDLLRDRKVSVDTVLRGLEASGLWLRRFHAMNAAGTAKVLFPRRLQQLDELKEAVPRGRPGKRLLGWMHRRLRSSYHAIEGRRMRRGRLHGDFKPENLLIDADRVTAIDFGHVYRSCLWNDVACFLVHMEWAVFRHMNLRLLVRMASLRRAFLMAYQDEAEAGAGDVLAWLECEALFRMAHRHFSGVRVRPRDLVALVLIAWMFRKADSR
jgi:aminoglycoside phosphotransferase (APT) family kinase protein